MINLIFDVHHPSLLKNSFRAQVCIRFGDVMELQYLPFSFNEAYSFVISGVFQRLIF